MVELGRVDIATEISFLSPHLSYPREGHLDAALHVMGYLKQKHNSRLIFDPTYPDINVSSFPTSPVLASVDTWTIHKNNSI
jgi:hypothetical protein